ncbi:MAG: LuxR C-terminal-related transcriptional regulator [bacterium]|nr:LuxR C-terminal-related transcriptional regulator [bacterium]
MEILTLNDLEKEVFELFSKGYKISEISEKLEIGEKKLSRVFKDVETRLNAKNKIHAMCLLIKKNLL